VTTEQELLRRVSEGDPGAVQALFDLYADTLRACARRWLPARLNRKVSVADVLQEARLAAHRRARAFVPKEPGSLRNWLLRIVQLKVKEEVRRHTRAKRSVAREISRGEQPADASVPDGGCSPSEGAAREEVRNLTCRALGTLTQYRREVVRLSWEGQLTLKQVAARMGRSYESVKKAHGRALSRLSRELEKIHVDGP